MKGILLLAKGEQDAQEKTDTVRRLLAALWPMLPFDLEHSGDAWTNLLYRTGGKFPAYFDAIVAGTDSEQNMLYSFAVVRGSDHAMGTATLVKRLLEANKPVYAVHDDAAVETVSGVQHIAGTRTWRVLTDGTSGSDDAGGGDSSSGLRVI